MIATMIKEARASKGLTQRELSEQTNISHRSIQRIESGKVNPRFYTLKVLAEHLDISLDHLLQQSEELEEVIGTDNLKKVLSLACILSIIFVALTFFPESVYASTTFWVGVVIANFLVLFLIWKK